MTVRAVLRTLPLLCAVLLLSQCAGKKPAYKSASYTSDRLATIPHGMARDDYPFADDGRYRKDWVAGGGGGRSKKTSRPEKEAPRRSSTPSPSRPVASSPSPAAVVASSPPPAPASKPAARYHKVVKGDTLFGLSSKYKVSVADIKRVNGLSGDLIKLGQSLRIP